MCALIGPDLVKGLGGFGNTISEAVHDLASGFAEHGYQLRGNRVCVEIGRRLIDEVVGPGQRPADAINTLADRLEEAGSREEDLADPDWVRIGREEPLVPVGHDWN